jgi:hypothetical protein
MIDDNLHDDAPAHESQEAPLSDQMPLAPDDLQAVADLFEIFFRWDDEAKARMGTASDGAVVRGETKQEP